MSAGVGVPRITTPPMTYEQYRAWCEVWWRVRDWPAQYAIAQEDLSRLVVCALALTPGATVLELGVCHGRTLAALALAVAPLGGRAWGIDHWGLEGSRAEVEAELGIRNIHNYSLLEGNTHGVPWDLPLDMLVVDAGHDEANVREDIAKYVPLVKVGGSAWFDDYDEPELGPEASPHWAVRHYADRACAGPGWRDLGIGERIRGWRRVA